MLDIEKDALVIVIDMHNFILLDAVYHNTLKWWRSYYFEKIDKIVELLEYCNKEDIKIQELLLYGKTNKRLKHIIFKKAVDYSDFSHLYFCGVSLDQCVAKEYFRISHPNKTLIKNCTLQEAEYCLDIDWCIKNIPFRHGISFPSLDELEKHVDKFLKANKINWINI